MFVFVEIIYFCIDLDLNHSLKKRVKKLPEIVLHSCHVLVLAIPPFRVPCLHTSPLTY